ncbi:HAMP domain-containing histidine kinase, partial [Porphyromonadaceae bacterium OttesenSCG-928-L07]|nr:HAMP domain-containing histidine kinase [Porphyromonadaceae bacterium OttesenSCG-928-L07]
MKLIYRIITRISVALLLILTTWATIFYFIIIEEINDETDDSLEDYSEQIITRALAGEPLPSKDNGTNNSYHISAITPEYAEANEGIRYFDEMVYIKSKKETEPARILKTIFRDADNRYYELTVSIPTIEKEDLQKTILLWIISLYILLLIVIIGINFWILQRSFSPLYIILKWLNQYSIDKEILPLKNDTKITEFRKLNEAVMQSAVRNSEMYEQQKLFIGNASHELQTPLAICQNRLELLLDDANLSEHQLEEIIKTRQTLDHIIKLNKTLLLLTKIENKQFPEQKKIHVNELIQKLLADYSEVYAYRSIHVSLHEDATLYVNMNESLASVLFSNLIKNAFTHNNDEGQIEITITSNGIRICNSGPAVELNPDQIFKRFYQGNKKEGSTGLGLALTDSICKLYGITIKYRFVDKKHCFS